MCHVGKSAHFTYNILMELDVVIPAFNEEKNILSTIHKLSAALSRIEGLTWKIIVAENGSSDNTYSVVSEAALPCVEIFHSSQKGKGLALREAAEKSQAEYFAFIDADCSVDPKIFSSLLPLLQNNTADIVVGSRFHRETVIDRSFLRHESSRLFNLLAKMITGIQASDTQCPLKIMNGNGKTQLLQCAEDTWFLDLELIARAEKNKLRIAALPVIWTEFVYPERKSKLVVAKDGWGALRAMWNIRKRVT